ncbi:MAG TPA: F0F1 ATP synthase subunit delta [Candidatus Paceibacterota bacterium]
MERVYAEALWEMVEKGKAAHEAVAALKKMLEARGRLALLPRIGKAFQRLAAKEAKKNTCTLTIARQKDAQKAVKEVEQVLAELKIGDTDLCETVDESLIGGWRLEGRGMLVDQSWKKALLDIYTRATS